MKRLLFSLTFLSLGFLCFNFIQLQYHLRSSGSPGGNTGAPGQFGGRTCANASCHSGGDSFRAGMITSDIPVGGYIPGQTYTITGTVSEPGRVKFGFEISPQDSMGNRIGTLTRTNTTETKFTNSNKSLTHTSNGNSGPGGTKSWSFDWTAPVKGTGGFSFWGAFNASNNNGASSGDMILRSELRIEEDPTFVASEEFALAQVFLGPNPFQDNLRISFPTTTTEKLTYSIFDLSGRELIKGRIPRGSEFTELDLNELNSGQYMVMFRSRSGNFNLEKRIIKR